MRSRRPSSSPSGLNWGAGKGMQCRLPSPSRVGLRPQCPLLATGHAAASGPFALTRLFDYRGRLSPVPVPRAVPVEATPGHRPLGPTMSKPPYLSSSLPAPQPSPPAQPRSSVSDSIFFLNNFHFVISKIIESHIFTLENR